MTTTRLDQIVDGWLTIPDIAERLALPPAKVRRLIEERRLVGVRRGDPPVLSVPEPFLVPAHLANPAQPRPVAEGSDEPAWAILASLHGTFTVLADSGFDDEGALEWLFTPSDALSGTPLQALLAGRKSQVRRLAQAEL